MRFLQSIKALPPLIGIVHIIDTTPKRNYVGGVVMYTMATKSFVVVFTSLLAKKYIRTLMRCIKNVLKIEDEPYTSICRDEHLILVEAHDPVFASSAIERLYGIEKVLIARQIKNDYNDIVETTTEVGGNLLLGNETFYVQVEGYSRGFLPKDAEMAITSSIIEEKSSQNVRPGTQDRHDKLLYVYMTQSNAYISIFEDKCFGGLPLGVQGKAVSCIFDEMSAMACLETIRMGYNTKILALYRKESDLTNLAKIINKILPYLIQKKIQLTIHKVSPGGQGFLNMVILATELAINIAKDHNIPHITLPISRIIFPGLYVDKLLHRIYDTQLNPILALPDYEQMAATSDRLNLSFNTKSTQYKLLKIPPDMKQYKIKQYNINIKLGPNNIHDILDNMGQLKQT